ncbi:glycosyltransferase [Butyrivibrio sp. AE3004]|uniref:glycosyltransferase n=1 Tax=Butyrivibrio sp. AE3004 TaxID=1506994 RepID=UPI000A4E0C10|nr:glycosyltransferase [Butyrivibrio sp. AE3004]
MSVNVLMCTYNGEKYLGAQLDSIINQSYKDLVIYVRDDGSTDNTAEIIRGYEKEYPGKVVFVKTEEHLGYPDCFWDILKKCPTADYYAFSDQDDVWETNKIERAVEYMACKGRSLSLYIHDYDNCNGNLELISHHAIGDISLLTDRSILFYTYASGFCMVIDNNMRDMLNSLSLIGKAMYHDEICIWLAHFYGKTLYDDATLTKYRRHESTVTEYGNGIIKLISNWLRREILGREFGDKCKRIKHFLAIKDDVEKYIAAGKYRFDTSDIKKFPVKTYREWSLLSGNNDRLGGYLKRLFYPHRLRPTIGGELALRILFLLNRNEAD